MVENTIPCPECKKDMIMLVDLMAHKIFFKCEKCKAKAVAEIGQIREYFDEVAS